MVSSFLSRRLCMVVKRVSMSSKAASANAGDEVLFDTAGKIGFITLNRPKALNSLNLNMIRLMYPQLRRYEANPDIGAIVLRAGTGAKAFCAGGDVVSITRKGALQQARDFFREEYLLDYATAQCTKPYVSLIDGICMGGGFGISVHGKFRVATERMVFAMPESHIGLFPDVGGGYFLPRLPGNLGVFLGLTGFRLKGWDVYKAGITTHFCRAEILPELERVLARLYEPNFESIKNVLDDFHGRSTIGKEFVLQPHLDQIAKIFDPNVTIEKLLENLKVEGSEWSQKQVDILRKASPTSLKISQRLFQHSDNLDMADDLQIEYRLAARCAADNDFPEGIRALLVDKTQDPKWEPSSIELVSDEKVDFYFSPLPEDLPECEVAKEYEKPVDQ